MSAKKTKARRKTKRVRRAVRALPKTAHRTA